VVRLIARRASPFDFLKSVDVSGRCWVRTRRTFGQQARVLAESAAVTLVTRAGELVAVVGIYLGPLSEVSEVWMAAGPALKANLLAALRHMAIFLEGVAIQLPGLELTAYVDPAGVAGDRLALMLGFEPTGLTDGLRTWRRVL
jgi:hypothetical protein